MRKAFVCAWVPLRLYLRSGRIVFPLLALIGYPMLFYYVIPVDALSSFAMSAAVAFFLGAWVAVAAAWSEDGALRQVLLVKCGQARYFRAQRTWLALLGAAGGAFLVLAPMLANWFFVPDMFVEAPSLAQAALGLALNACAGVCGGAFGTLFHPRLLRDGKTAYLLALLIGLAGLVGGMAGVPLWLRALLPPLYDTIEGIGRAGALTAESVLPRALWYLLYAGFCAALQSAILRKTGE